jgi:hypothetical protein
VDVARVALAAVGAVDPMLRGPLEAAVDGGCTSVEDCELASYPAEAFGGASPVSAATHAGRRFPCSRRLDVEPAPAQATSDHEGLPR